MKRGSQLVLTFLAGALSTLAFHQGVLAVMFAAGLTARVPYDLSPTRPFHVPAIVSLCFWGGAWAAAIRWAVERAFGSSGSLRWFAVAGTVLPSLVTWFVVMPLKGEPVAGGWQLDSMGGVLLVNVAWSLGVCGVLVLARRFGFSGSHGASSD